MKVKVPWTIPRGQGHVRFFGGTEFAGSKIEFPNKDFIESQINMQDESACGVGADLVSMGSIVAAKSETAGGSMHGSRWPDLSGIDFHIGGWPERAVLEDR